MSPESPLHSLSVLDWGHLIAICVHVPPEPHEPFVSNVRVAPGKQRALTPRPQCQLCRILVSTLQVRTGDLGSLGISAGPHGQEQQNLDLQPQCASCHAASGGQRKVLWDAHPQDLVGIYGSEGIRV